MPSLNASGVTRLVTKLKDYFAASAHNHASSDINSGTLDTARIPSLDASKIGSGSIGVARGGTGATSAADARTNLSVPSTTDLGEVASSLAAVEQGATATANHAKGSHFMLGNELRKATSAIATGNSITNSNSTTDTLQGQIDSINSSLAVQNGGTSDEKVVYVTYGKVVQILVRGVTNATSSAYTMPSGLRPRGGMNFIDGKAAISYDGVVSTNVANAWDSIVYVANH